MSFSIGVRNLVLFKIFLLVHMCLVSSFNRFAKFGFVLDLLACSYVFGVIIPLFCEIWFCLRSSCLYICV